MTVPVQKDRFPGFLEKEADLALFSGQQQRAKNALHEGVRSTYAHSPLEYHHFALKSVALPFYDLALQGYTTDRFEEALSVYGLVGNLLDNELNNHKYGFGSPSLQGHYLGRMSELTIFGLLARDFTDINSLIPLPSSRADDVDLDAGTDFYITSLSSRGQFDHLQVKTAIKDGDRERYEGNDVRLIGLSDLDSFYKCPDNAGSLASTIVHELAGQASDQDITRLAAATENMYDILASQASNRLVDKLIV